MIRNVKEQTAAESIEQRIPSVMMETEYGYEQPEMEHIQTEERMSFSFGPEDQTDVTAVEPKRRKSLVDVHTGTKPNLPVKQEKDPRKSSDNNILQNQNAAKVSDSEPKGNEKHIQLPTGQKLVNLSKFHVSSTLIYSIVHEYRCLTSIRFMNCYSYFIFFSIQTESMSKLLKESDTGNMDLSGAPLLPFPHKEITPLKNSKLEKSKKPKRVQSQNNANMTYSTPLKLFKSYR